MKIKLFATGSLALIVLGGALAFKAHLLFPDPEVFCHQASDADGQCSKIAPYQVNDNGQPGTQNPCQDQSSYAVHVAGSCSTTTTVYPTDIIQ